MNNKKSSQQFEISIEIADEFEGQIAAEDIRRAACAALLAAGLGGQPIGLSVDIAGDDEVQRLNREYRGVDRTTDVLSFASEEAPDWDGRPGVVYRLQPADADEVLDEPDDEWVEEYDDEADDGPGAASSTFQAPAAPAFVLPPELQSSDSGGTQRYLGDIIISYPQAERQSADFGNDPQQEVQELVIHGVFHLLGYDHEEEQEREIMRGREEAAAHLLDEAGEL